MILFFYIFYVVNCAAVLSLFLKEVRRASPIAVLWFGVFAFFLLPSFFDPFVDRAGQHAYSVVYDLSTYTLVKVQLYVFLVLLAYFLCSQVLFKVFGRGEYDLEYFKAQLNSSDENGKYALFCILLLVSFSFFEVFSKFGMGVFGGFGFVDRRESLSLISGFLLSYNLFICAGFVYWLFSRGKVVAASGVFVFYLLIYLILGGSRQPLIVVILPFVFGFIFLSRHVFAYSVLLCFSYTLIAKALQFMLYLRNLSGWDARLDAFRDFFNILFFSEEAIASNESGLRFAFYYFVQEYEKIQSFGGFSYLLRLAFFWLPSRFDPVGLKPPDFEYEMFAVFMPGYVGTMHPTFFGTLFADAGWFFLPWVLFISVLTLMTYRILPKFNSVLFFPAWALFAYAYMMMARGAIYGPFVVLVLGLCVLYLVQRVTTFMSNKRC
ncbi:hypothetical protein [Halopseudomonas laoshanensis]|uniref:hypothetical protein n=1 Tax=Halopseudomonas laoshanensis TaxID=2268758 RepID=UPI0037366BE9